MYYWCVVILIMMGINMFILLLLSQNTVETVTYDIFLDNLQAGEITQVEVRDDSIYYKIASDEETSIVYNTVRMQDTSLVDRLYDAGVTFTEVLATEPSIFSTIISTVIMLVIFSLIWQFIMRKLMGKAGGMGNAMSFGKSNAKVYVAAQTGKTFQDVAGQDEAKEALTEIVDFLHHPDKYTEIGAKLPKGA